MPDSVELLDLRLARLIRAAGESELIALVDLRTRPLVDPPVWRERWNPETESFDLFDSLATAAERFAHQKALGSTLDEIKDELSRELCLSSWINVDPAARPDLTRSELWNQDECRYLLTPFQAAQLEGKLPERYSHWIRLIQMDPGYAVLYQADTDEENSN